MKKLMLSVFALAAFGFSVNAADFATGTGTAELRTSIGVEVGTNLGVLSFGTITINNVESVITMTAGGIETSDGNSVVTTAGSPADFTVSGLTDATYAVQYETSVTLSGTLSGNTTELTITEFSGNAAGTINAIAASNEFQVGGTLTIPPLAVIDSYSGAFDVTVVYN